VLRKNDNLKPLGAALERAARAIQRRVHAEADELDRLADEARRAEDASGARRVATRLAQLADEKRRSATEPAA
jgi:hypothetical protein